MKCEEVLDSSMDFFMNWIAGLPISIAQQYRVLRVPLIPIALLWIPLMFVLFMPLILLWCAAEAIAALWGMMNDA